MLFTRYAVTLLLVATGAVASAAGAFAQSPDAVRVAAAASELADGEIRRVDKESAKLTIRHGPIKSLDMPSMTMVFQVKDKAMLDQVKAGDKIKFTAENVNGAYTVTTLEPAK